MKRNNKKTMIYTFLLSCLVTATSCNRDSYTPSQGDEIKKVVMLPFIRRQAVGLWILENALLISVPNLTCRPIQLR
jgi:hypothetical protein